MGKNTPFRAPRPYSPDAIDTEPLQGRARNDFESSLFTRVKRSQQHVLRIILDHAAGKADCWPGNKRMAEIAGYQVRNIQVILRALEAAQVIRCVVDRSLKTQRRIVLCDHPHAIMVFNRLGDRPWMQVGAQKTAPGQPMKQPQKVGAGVQKSAHSGAQGPVGLGAQGRPAKSFPGANPKLSIPGGVSRSREGGRPRSRADQLAWLEAQIAASRTVTIANVNVCRT